MKILILSALYPPHVIGGAEKSAALLAEGLVRQGHQVVVLSLHPQQEELVEEQNGVRVYRLPLDNYYWIFDRSRKPNPLLHFLWHLREIWNRKAARRVGRILDIERPDVVHTHNLSGFSVSVWREVARRKIRLVHTLHDYYLLCSRSSLFRNGKICERRCMECRMLTFNRNRCSGFPDAVVSVSQYTLDQHVKRGFFTNSRHAVIRNIHGREQVASSTPAGTERDLDFTVFGYIGRIEEAKGIETLLTAVGRLGQHNWKLRIAGTGRSDYVQALSARFADPRIEWLGFADPDAFYASVDVVVVPSLWADPLPYVCVEALHAHRRLVCARSGGIPEIAQLAPNTEFFPAGDAATLAQKLNLMMTRARPLAEHGAADDAALSVFSEASVTRAYVDVYAPNRQA